MFHYHGWIEVHATPGELDNSDKEDRLEEEAVAFARDIASRLDGFNMPVAVRALNGAYNLEFSGNKNRRAASRWDELISSVRDLARRAPGSYGLIYMRDGDDEENRFQVFVVKRGDVVETEDPFLSPCIPVIEDPWEA